MSKLNSYQKLKLENENLKKDIFDLVRNADKLDGIKTKLRYEMMYDSFDSVMLGSHGGTSKVSSGILAQVSGKNDVLDEEIMQRFLTKHPEFKDIKKDSVGVSFEQVLQMQKTVNEIKNPLDTIHSIVEKSKEEMDKRENI